MGFFDFFWQARKYVKPDTAALDQPPEADVTGQVNLHKRIVLFAAVLGIGYAGMGTWFMLNAKGSEEKAFHEFLGVPPVFAVIGAFCGVALGCLFAPTRFLESPVGKKWMNLIGTSSIVAARLVCLAVALFLAAVPFLLWALLQLEKTSGQTSS